MNDTSKAKVAKFKFDTFPKYGRLNSFSRIRIRKSSRFEVLNAHKTLDYTNKNFKLDSVACKNWTLRIEEIQMLFNSSKFISGIVLDLEYEVYPCWYEGDFLLESKRGRYELNAASFIMLTFEDTTMYLSCNTKLARFLSTPQKDLK